MEPPKLNMLDTAGYAGSGGAIVSVLRFADAAVLVVSMPARVGSGTEQV
jgi:translation elongation factor EF-G